MSAWQAITCLTPDALQLADAAWSPLDAARVPLRQTEAVRSAQAAAAAGAIAPLRTCILDVLCAPADGADRVPIPGRGDPIVAISCLASSALLPSDKDAGVAGDEEVIAVDDGVTEDVDLEEGNGSLEEDAENGGQALVALRPDGPTSTRSQAASTALPQDTQLTIFLHRLERGDGKVNSAARLPQLIERQHGARVLVYDSETAMLGDFLRYVRALDPDVLAVFGASDVFAPLIERCAALRIEGGGLLLGRGRAGGALARPLALKRVTMYSASWVRSQSRMSSTSNQETFRAECPGRLAVDVLRQVLTGQNLATFSLVDCVQSILGRTLEVLAPWRLAGLLKGGSGGGSGGENADNDDTDDGEIHTSSTPVRGIKKQPKTTDPPNAASLLRVARYCAQRAVSVRALLVRLATVPELVEMARATGLTLTQTAYQAQMIRTHSLLLRAAARAGYAVPGRQDPVQLAEHTFILHPLEHRTAGLHRDAVAILDFASLYPSIYRAHNLCYTTLLHPNDRDKVAPEDVTVTPTGRRCNE